MTVPNSTSGMGLEHRQLLSASWLLRLARDAGYKTTQFNLPNTAFFVDLPDAFHVDVIVTDNEPWIAATASDPAEQARIDELVRQSGSLTASGDFGGVVWYQATLAGHRVPYRERHSTTHLREILDSHARISEWRRLGRHILLNFREELPNGNGSGTSNLLFAPKQFVDVYLAVPGPANGPFTSPIAHRNIEMVAAICAFALGGPVDFPLTIFTAPHEAWADLEARRRDPSILTLSKNGISLDLFDRLADLGGRESVARARAALLIYEAAARQEREQVAVVLYVVAAECLTNPFKAWKTERLTTRFINFFEELMPQELDAFVQNTDLEQAFGIVRGSRTARALRRELLTRLYDSRSNPVHEGLLISFDGFAGMAQGPGLRRALASAFAQSAITRFLESPRTSLIGHPNWTGE